MPSRRAASSRPSVVPGVVQVALSTSAVYPQSIDESFRLAAELGYDGLEIMVWTDPLSQDGDAIAALSLEYGVPVLAVHAPTLLITQRVWGKAPWNKITGAVELAQRLGADTVVAHPPFRWQREYADEFVAGVRDLTSSTGVAVAVENMYPWRVGNREIPAYLPDWDPSDEDYDHVCLDLSHTATAGSDAMEMARRLTAAGRLRHLHLCDGTSSAKDEHLVPGRGEQPCEEVLGVLTGSGWSGTVVLEVNTRKCRTLAERELDLTESLAFARRHLSTGPGPGRVRSRRAPDSS